MGDQHPLVSSCPLCFQVPLTWITPHSPEMLCGEEHTCIQSLVKLIVIASVILTILGQPSSGAWVNSDTLSVEGRTNNTGWTL
jgi:hypothetical protein